MIIKVTKIGIKRPVNIEKSMFYQSMGELQYQCWKLANKGIRMMWDFQGFDFIYKEKYGKYFFEENKKTPNGYKNISSDILNELKDEIYVLPANCKDAMIRMVEKKWKSDLKDVLLGNKSIPNFKKTLPIELHNKQFMDSKKNIRIYKEEDNYFTTISLFSKSYANDIGLKNGNLELEITVKDDYLITIVDRIMNGEYKLSISKLVFHKKKWFLHLYYSFTPEVKELNVNKILGVDLGINIPAMCAVSDSMEHLAVGTKSEIVRFEREANKKRKELQNSSNWAADGAVGHGLKRRVLRLKKLSNKVSKYKDTKNHCYSKAVVDFALKQNCGIIQFEDLSGIAEENLVLKNWNYHDLQKKIEYKALEHGIKVIKIKPSYTSQRCHKCGFVHKSIDKKLFRAKQEFFSCLNCGFTVHADLNAARNIAIKNIEQIIIEQIEFQEKKIDHHINYLL